jgi:hypothetical protein
MLPRRSNRPRRKAANERDELAPFQLTELHLVPSSLAGYRFGEDQVRGSLRCGISARLKTEAGHERPICCPDSPPKATESLGPAALDGKRSPADDVIKRTLAIQGYRHNPGSVIVRTVPELSLGS